MPFMDRLIKALCVVLAVIDGLFTPTHLRGGAI